MKSKPRLVMIGNGMAGVACLERVLQAAPGRFDVTVLGDEPHPNYNRIMLSKVLTGHATLEDIIMNPVEWYAAQGIDLRTGSRAVAIDRQLGVVTNAMGENFRWDKLIIATGSRAFVPPIPGCDLPGVTVYRTVEDCVAMREASRTLRRAVVIGGGLLGLEAARALLDLGMQVSVVHMAPFLMERQLDASGGLYLGRMMKRQGLEILTGKLTSEIVGDGHVEGIRFKDGGEVATDMVVLAAGIRPNSEIAQDAGLITKRGIVVNDWMQTSDSEVYAVGECAEHRGICYGIVAPLYEQGKALAAHLTETAGEPYTGSVMATKLKVSGVDVFSAGDFVESEECDVTRVEDSARGIYQKAVFRDGRLVGAILIGDVALSGKLDGLIRSGEYLNGTAATLLVGNTAGATDNAAPSLEALPDDAVICGCNGVCKGTIVSAIRDKGLTTRKEVAGCTNASRSCGGCGGQVEELIAMVHGAVAPKSTKKPLCDCTEYSREEVVALIREEHLLRVEQVLKAVGCEGGGCAKCRPAINYFLTMIWPGQNEDDPRSRFINERVHANIQKDGTYSVVPRIYGGVTTPDELMRIAQAAVKFQVPLVKFTGGQRLDLLGVTKENLPAIWEELDMPSGYAYAKALRTVKTCVGNTFCRFGTRDSMGFGIRIEKTFEGIWTPAKVKMAVNACPRNCAESLIKDVGLIGVDKAWEIYVGGNGGVRVRQAELLGAVETDDEAIEIIGAFLQLYREEADYNSRTSEWCEAVGMDYLKKAIVVDVENRQALWGRIQQALALHVDPWKQRVDNIRLGHAEVANEFQPLASVLG